MKFISHRGNLRGRNSLEENSPKTITSIISQGYCVEVDVWEKNNILFLGHDKPEWEVDLEFLKTNHDKLYIHCKNDAALFRLSALYILEVFSHANDAFTLSKKGNILIHPITVTTYRKGILIMPEMSNYSIGEILEFDGIITDNVKFYEDYYNSIRKYTHNI